MRVLGVDYGGKRIGLALSDATQTLASPWRTIERPSAERAARKALLDEIRTLIAEEDGLAAVVIGWPRRLDGSATHMTVHVETLARALQGELPIPVVLQDERLSSQEAESRLSVRDKNWRSRKKKLDATAAAIVLQDYLDHHR